MHLKPLTDTAMQLYDYATAYADISLWSILLLIHNNRDTLYVVWFCNTTGTGTITGTGTTSVTGTGTT